MHGERLTMRATSTGWRHLMVEGVYVSKDPRVGLKEVRVEANEILTALPLPSHNLILPLLLHTKE